MNSFIVGWYHDVYYYCIIMPYGFSEVSWNYLVAYATHYVDGKKWRDWDVTGFFLACQLSAEKWTLNVAIMAHGMELHSEINVSNSKRITFSNAVDIYDKWKVVSASLIFDFLAWKIEDHLFTFYIGCLKHIDNTLQAVLHLCRYWGNGICTKLGLLIAVYVKGMHAVVNMAFGHRFNLESRRHSCPFNVFINPICFR